MLDDKNEQLYQCCMDVVLFQYESVTHHLSNSRLAIQMPDGEVCCVSPGFKRLKCSPHLRVTEDGGDAKKKRVQGVTTSAAVAY